MPGVPQLGEYPPEENHSSSTELKMHTGVKQQAALFGTADRGRCETWPSFLCNVSIHPLVRRRELQGQLECLAATKEYFIAKGWLPAKHILGTPSPPPARLKYMTKCPFPHRHSAGVAEGAKNTGRFTLQAYQRQTANPSCSRGQKKERQEGQYTLFPTLLQRSGQERDHFLLPSHLISQCSFPAKPKGE